MEESDLLRIVPGSFLFGFCNLWGFGAGIFGFYNGEVNEFQ